MLSAKRDATAAERFFRKTLSATHTQAPRVINVDKNAAYPKTTDMLTADDTLPKTTSLRQNKYLNNIVEQDHRFIKRLVNPGMGFGSFACSATNVEGIRGNEHDYCWDKFRELLKETSTARVGFVYQIFGLVA